MYPRAVIENAIVHDPTLSGVALAGLGHLADVALPATIDTLAQDTAAIIQATTNPNQPAVIGGQPIGGMPAASAAISVGTLLAVGVGVFILAAAMKGR